MTISGNKVIRTVCRFTELADREAVSEDLAAIEASLTQHGYTIQTRRACFKDADIASLRGWEAPGLFLSVGRLDRDGARAHLGELEEESNVAFHLDLTAGVETADVDLLFQIIQEQAKRTFLFTYTFNNPPSSPYFPSSEFAEPGFSIGLQPTDLAEGCDTLEAWCSAMRSVWEELCGIFADRPDFLGIDSSVAPLFEGKSSLVHFVRRVCGSFDSAATSDFFLELTRFVKEENPKPVGLCGLMLPCLEDFELAEEYEAGRFDIERNVFLSLHSGLGIDTYPIGIDEDPSRVQQILELLCALSGKYGKPLSARFVSDGKTRMGKKSDFQNPYLKDVVIRAL